MARLIRTEKEVEGRFEEVWIVVEEDPLEQWPAGPLAVVGRPRAAQGRPRAGARRGALHRRPQAAGDAARGRPPLAARAREACGGSTSRRRSRCRACGPRSGRARRTGSRRRRASRARPSPPSPPTRSRQARAAVEAIEIEWEELEVVLDPDDAVRRELLTDAEPRALRARRRRARARRGGRRRRGRRTARRPSSTTRSRRTRPSASGRATRSTSTSRRSSSGASAQAVAEQARPARGQGARRLRVHGRRLRLEERPRRVHVRRRGAREADGPAGALRADAARGEHLRGQPQRDDPAAPRRRPQRRDDRRVRRRVHELRRLVRLERRRPRGRCRCSTTARTSAPSRYGAKINTPPMKAFRAPGFVEGTFGLECLIDELAARLEHRPARAAAPQLRELERRHAVLLQEPRGVLPAARSRTGSGGTRCARAPMPSGSAASGWRARSGTAAAGLPRTRGCALGSRRPRDGDHGDAGHRHRDAHRDGADRRRGARAAARARRGRARRLGARAVRLDLGRLLDHCRRWGRRCGRPRPTRSGR